MAKAKARVAVVGASGIGKHHANWWTLEGAEVCAFAGTSESSVAATRDVLSGLFGFAGHAYTDVGRMIADEAPDIVDVCSPPALHFAHVRAALEADCDVLCEKPFVYDPGLDTDALLAQAGELSALADAREKRLGMCSQYHVAALLCRAILEEHTGRERIQSYVGRLASPAGKKPVDARAAWIDLAPHMLAALHALVPEGKVDFESVEVEISGSETTARFRLQTRDGGSVPAEVWTGKTLADAEVAHVRALHLNGARFSIGGVKGADGVYGARIETPWGDFDREDAMRLTIREFLAGGNVIDAKAATRNLAWLLGMS